MGSEVGGLRTAAPPQVRHVRVRDSGGPFPPPSPRLVPPHLAHGSSLVLAARWHLSDCSRRDRGGRRTSHTCPSTLDRCLRPSRRRSACAARRPARMCCRL